MVMPGCGDDDDNPVVETGDLNLACHQPGNPCDIRPLAVGNSWTWERLSYDTSGQEMNRDTIYESIDRDTTIDGETWYHVSPVWYTLRDDGLWYNDIGFSVDVLYKYPAQVGDSFSCAACSFYKVVTSTDTTLDHPLGQALCYEYMTVSEWQDTSYVYVAPGVGTVESKSYYRLNESALYLGGCTRLIDYHLE